jgi:hypothetical protein
MARQTKLNMLVREVFARILSARARLLETGSLIRARTQQFSQAARGYSAASRRAL